VKGGDQLALDITVSNRNATNLETADLLVEFPDGTRDPKDLAQELPRTRVALGDIAAGAIVQKNVPAVLFGGERETKNIKVTVEYRVPGSNSLFYKESSYQVVISSAPLTVSVDVPKEANSGQELSFTVTVKSNSSDTVRNVLLSAQYPAGFQFKSADPKPFAQNSIWNLGDVNPGGVRTFTIYGTLVGENLDARIFRFNVGIADPKDPKTISTPFASASEQLSINKPFIGLSVAANGSESDVVPIKSGEPVQLQIGYVNNLLVPISDVSISVVLTGDALDKSSVSTSDGFYRSLDNTVIWDKTTSSQFKSLAPGEQGMVSVSFASRSINGGIATLRSPQVQLSANVSGRRVESGRVPQDLKATVKKTFQVQSDVSLNGRVLYYAAPIKNTGPMPPKAEKETTYNIIWTITNGSNDLSEAYIAAHLPPYVRFVKSQDGGESVTYSDTTGVLTWNAGAVKAGTGYGTAPRQVVFQVAMTPSVSQIGQSPVLLTNITLSAIDRFTNSKISMPVPNLDIHLYSDPAAKGGDDRVVQ
jgi:uncharacterized repeat protein (TIGR01451 family)